MRTRPSCAPSVRLWRTGRCVLALGLASALGCRPSAPDATPAGAADSTASVATPAPGTLPGRIAFVSERDGDGGEVYRFDGATAATVRLTRRPGADYPVAALGADLLVLAADTAGRESLARLDSAGALRPLRITTRTLRNPVVSADGAHVVFEADFASLRDLYRYDVAADRLVRLTTSETGAFDPSLSPDGRRLVYASSREGDAELYTMPIDGEGPNARDAVRLTAFHRDDHAPRWSPNGGAIAFLSDREGINRLFLVAPDGTNLRRLLASTDTLVASAAEGEAVWSPDGRFVAFEVQPPGGGAQLWVADVASGARRRLASGLRSASGPTWSPDGRWLAFTGIRPGDADDASDVYAVRADGSGAPLRLSDAPGPDWLPRWLP